MRAAVFTVSPQTSYWNFFLPTMPATTGPVCTPMRMPKWAPPRLLRSAMKSRISSAACTTSAGCVRLRTREATDGHVGVSDGLDLLHATLGDDDIEGVEAIVELAHEIGRRESGGELGEAFKVGEENGDARVVPRLGAAVPLQFDGGLGREDVVQQIVGTAFFLIQLGGALGDFLFELFVQHGVIDGNGDLAGKQREQTDPLPGERAGSQVVFLR